MVGEVPRPTGGVAVARAVAQSFEEAYLRLYASMLRYAQRLLGRDDGYDAVAEAVADLWTRWPSLPPDQQNDKYMFGAVRNSVLAKRRDRRSHASLDDEGVQYELEQRTARAFRNRIQGDRLFDVLDLSLAALSPRRREILRLVKEQGFTYEETAELLGLRYETVHSHLRQGLADLRAAFTRAGYRIANTQARLKQLPAPKGGDSND